MLIVELQHVFIRWWVTAMYLLFQTRHIKFALKNKSSAAPHFFNKAHEKTKTITVSNSVFSNLTAAFELLLKYE